jgi:hypothetical protein
VHLLKHRDARSLKRPAGMSFLDLAEAVNRQAGGKHNPLSTGM